MALWEGETRRATFTQGMTNAKIFTGGAENGVIVYDEDSGDAYFVDFVIDSRELAFNIDKNFDLTELKVFGGNEYLLKIGDSIFWQNYAEEIEVANGLDLEKFTYKDDYVYFMADSGSVADFIGNISASGVCVFKFTPGSYEAVLNDIEFSFEDAVLGSDESGVYGKSGGEVWRVE
ncbi:MAG: hypothetical protein ACD_65C00205G0001 [uncultured bacterium]|nr:MAG: hypothetical protein ACD_65C00205G0001 [uncultured bacterium]